MQESNAAVQVTAVVDGARCGLLYIFGHSVVLMEIHDCPAVGDNMAFKAELIAQDVL